MGAEDYINTSDYICLQLLLNFQLFFDYHPVNNDLQKKKFFRKTIVLYLSKHSLLFD